MSVLVLAIAAAAVWAASPPAGGTDTPALRPADVGEFFVTPGQAATLQLKAVGDLTDAAMEYAVTDYWGKAVATGKAQRGEGGQVRLSVRLPAGYYDVEFPAAKARFGVVSILAAAEAPKMGTGTEAANPDVTSGPLRSQSPFSGQGDPFFCIDSAMSWLVKDDAVREGLVRALRRGGIAMSRERLTWGAASPAAGKYEWEAPVRFDTLRRTYARHGVPVLEMFHDAPGWLGHVGKYPADLVGAAKSWEEIARHWQDTWGAIEVWNEPDIFFGGDLPADQYAPLVHTAAWAMARGRIARPLVGGVMAVCNRRFLDSLTANGVLDRIDAFSFHTYDRAKGMESLVGQYRTWLADSSHASMPLWLTECGRPWRKGPPRPPTEQDAESALDIAMKAAEAKACGVERYFAFVYPYYEEGDQNFGMVGREATPLRSMAAYVAMAARLAGKEYLGDLEVDAVAGVELTRVFGDAKEAVAVLYRVKADAPTAKLPVPALRTEGIDGRKLDLPEGGRAVPIPDGLTYAWLDRAKLGLALRTETGAMKVLRASKAGVTTAPASSDGGRRLPSSGIVLRYQFDPAAVIAVSNGYRLRAAPTAPATSPPASAPAGRFSLAVRAFNLSDQPRDIVLTPTFVPKGAKVVGDAARAVAVAAGAFADAKWDLDPGDAFAASSRFRITVTAKDRAAAPAPAASAPAAADEKPPLAILAIDLSGEATHQQHVAHYARKVRLPIDDLDFWTPNVPRYGKMTMTRTDEGHWRLAVEFGKGDAWVYPFFRLSYGVSAAGYQGLVIRARCQAAAAVRVLVWEGETGVAYLTDGPSIIPADGAWHTAVVRFADLTLSGANAPDPNGRLDLPTVRKISFGMNSHVPRNSLEISDVYLVGGK
jgi:hypothetical protein